MSRACVDAKISRTEIYARRDRDDTFRAAWDDALLVGTDFLEDVLRDLAIGDTDASSGVSDKERPPVKKTYDAALLRFLLKARKPDLYGAHPRAGRADANEPIWLDTDPPRSDLGSDR